MIVEGFLNIVYSLVMLILSPLPDIEWVVEASMFAQTIQFLRVVLYIIPIGPVIGILSIFITIHSLRIVISLVKTIWELIPFL